MDLTTITAFRIPSGRDDLFPRDGEAVLAGGTWLFSQPNEELTGLVDLTALRWPDVTITAAGLSLAATCPIETVASLVLPDAWTAAPLFAQCAGALLASFKVQRIATIGGNVCTALPAGAMVSLCVALDADALLWSADGSERRMPVAAFVRGVRRTALAPGEVLRSLEFPARALSSRTAFRKLALSPLGRSGSVVTGRVDRDGSAVFTVTAATTRPHVLRFGALPDATALGSSVDAIEDWYDDPHGAPDWRRATTGLIAEQVGRELTDSHAGTSPEDGGAA